MREAATFTGKQLRDSIIFDPSRRLKGDAAAAMLDYVEKELSKDEGRIRALRYTDARNRRETSSAIFANLAASALNKIRPDRFVSIAFGKEWYANGGAYAALSYKSAIVVRDFLARREWTEGTGGINRFDYLDERFGMLTRVRATSKLSEVLANFGVSWREVSASRGEVIRITKRNGDTGPEPDDVAASRPALVRINARLATADISPPSEYWSRIAPAPHPLLDAGSEATWPAEGDTSATTIYRSFSRSWDKGGRLYGAWWLSEPEPIRKGIMIDGAPVCELDYRQLHPSLLFARRGMSPPNDVYEFGGHDRRLNKETFMRLLNGERMNLAKPGEEPFTATVPYEEYVTAYLITLSPISRWLGNGEGLRLQREDSDLAISILDDLYHKNIIALPVHDSFIVQQRHRDALYQTMKERFVDRYGVEPEIRE